MSNNQQRNQDNLDFSIPINNIGGNVGYNTGNLGNAPNVNNVNTSMPIQGEIKINPNVNYQDQQVDFTNFLQHANHPGVVFFTLLFKIISITSFLFLNLFISNEALTFIVVVIFSAFDFWFVKNVSGRILVGLRWWNEVKEDGSEVWIFESDHEVRKTSVDSTIFWGSLYITPIFWLIFFIMDLIGIKWMWAIVCLISLVLSGSNMVGYYKCSGEQKKKFSNFIMSKGSEQITNLFMGGTK